MEIGLVVPVLSNFTGFAELMESVDVAVKPIVIDNWNTNRGVAGGWNEGIKRGLNQDVLIVTNDDVKFHPGTIETMAAAIGEYDLVSGEPYENLGSGFLEDQPEFCCFAINPVNFVDKFGWFDENFTPAYFEDNDMHYRIKLGGGKTARIHHARIDHKGSVTQFKGSTDPDTPDRVVSHEQFRLNRGYYVTKWGGEPGDEKYTTPYNIGGDIKRWRKLG